MTEKQFKIHLIAVWETEQKLCEMLKHPHFNNMKTGDMLQNLLAINSLAMAETGDQWTENDLKNYIKTGILTDPVRSEIIWFFWHDRINYSICNSFGSVPSCDWWNIRNRENDSQEEATEKWLKIHDEHLRSWLNSLEY